MKNYSDYTSSSTSKCFQSKNNFSDKIYEHPLYPPKCISYISL